MKKTTVNFTLVVSIQMDKAKTKEDASPNIVSLGTKVRETIIYSADVAQIKSTIPPELPCSVLVVLYD